MFPRLAITLEGGNVALLAEFGKLAVLRQKAKSRMNGVRAGYDRRADDIFHAQIALGRGSRTDTDRLIRKLCVKSFSVSLRIYGYRLDPHFPACPDNTYGDLAAVCYQYLFYHVLPPIQS